MRRAKNEINTGSMADIAFLLLVFFLVATTIDVDSGLLRKLPPYIEGIEPPTIPKRNILNVRINANDELLINNELCDLKEIRTIALEFLMNPKNEDHKPKKKIKNISHLGDIEISQGIISLQNANGTSYNMYVKVLNELMETGEIMRNELSLEMFGKKYNDLPEKIKKSISKARPCIISEAEPVMVNI